MKKIANRILVSRHKRYPRLLCPICRSENVRQKQLDCISYNETKTDINVYCEGSTVSTAYRADDFEAQISMGFSCDSGHRFAYFFYQSKGHVIVELASPDLPSVEA